MVTLKVAGYTQRTMIFKEDFHIKLPHNGYPSYCLPAKQPFSCISSGTGLEPPVITFFFGQELFHRFFPKHLISLLKLLPFTSAVLSVTTGPGRQKYKSSMSNFFLRKKRIRPFLNQEQSFFQSSFPDFRESAVSPGAN